MPRKKKEPSLEPNANDLYNKDEIIDVTDASNAYDEQLTPSEYFEKIKGLMHEETSENCKVLFDIVMKKMKKYVITGQKKAAKELYAKAEYLRKEFMLLERGIRKYVLRKDIEYYIDKVASEQVVIIELKNYDREIPDEALDIVLNTQDLFDEYYVIFTDYTGEVRSKVAKEKRDKDPILFGSIFTDGLVSPKLYFLADWVDKYCDLTLDKMIEELAKESKKAETELVYNISDGLEDIEDVLNGNQLTNITVSK